MQSRSDIKAANIARFQQILTELADARGTVHGWTTWKLADLFNKRYAKETKPIGHGSIRVYIDAGGAAGWLSKSERIPGTPLIFTIVQTAKEAGDAA